MRDCGSVRDWRRRVENACWKRRIRKSLGRCWRRPSGRLEVAARGVGEKRGEFERAKFRVDADSLLLQCRADDPGLLFGGGLERETEADAVCAMGKACRVEELLSPLGVGLASMRKVREEGLNGVDRLQAEMKQSKNEVMKTRGGCATGRASQRGGA